MTHGREKSDPSVVAMKPANKLGQPGAESVERREGTEGNTGGQHMRRTQSREGVSQGLDRVREASQQRKKERFTALLHYVTVDRLTEAFSSLKRAAAPGVDGTTWQSYKQDLEINLRSSLKYSANCQMALKTGMLKARRIAADRSWAILVR